MSINWLKYLQKLHKCKNKVFFLGLTNEHTEMLGHLLHVIKQKKKTERTQTVSLFPVQAMIIIA